MNVSAETFFFDTTAHVKNYHLRACNPNSHRRDFLDRFYVRYIYVDTVIGCVLLYDCVEQSGN